MTTQHPMRASARRNMRHVIATLILLTLVLAMFLAAFVSTLVQLILTESGESVDKIALGVMSGTAFSSAYLLFYAPQLYKQLNEALPLGGVFFFRPKHRNHRSKSMR